MFFSSKISMSRFQNNFPNINSKINTFQNKSSKALSHVLAMTPKKLKKHEAAMKNKIQ